MLLFCNIFLLTYFNIKIFDIILLGSQFQAPLPIWKFPSPPAERAGGGVHTMQCCSDMKNLSQGVFSFDTVVLW